jgi:hypothetical protein
MAGFDMLRNVDITIRCDIEKAAPEERRFWGRAYIHQGADGQVVDVSGDVVDTPEAQRALEEAFYGFVKEARSGDAGHELFDAAVLIEGVAVTAEKIAAGLYPEGTPLGLVVGFEARDTEEGDLLWERVKDGTYKALSIVGEGWREPL